MNLFSKFTALSILLTLLSACGSPKTYYVLSPAGKSPSRQGIGIGVGPITMADYLVERPYLVFQSSPNRMELSDLHVWAGDLRDDFTRTLGTNLGRHKGTGNIRTYPWTRESELDYQVTVDVHSFHGTADGDAILEASWRAYRLPGSKLVVSKTSTLIEPLQQDGFESLVSAQSRLIDQLAQEISLSLR